MLHVSKTVIKADANMLHIQSEHNISNQLEYVFDTFVYSVNYILGNSTRVLSRILNTDVTVTHTHSKFN